MLRTSPPPPAPTSRPPVRSWCGQRKQEEEEDTQDLEELECDDGFSSVFEYAGNGEYTHDPVPFH